MMVRRLVLATLCTLWALLCTCFVGGALAKPPIDFSREVAPIFEQHCIRCHQPSNKKGELSLATYADLKSNEYVVAGDPDASYLVEVVTAGVGEKPLMPKEGRRCLRKKFPRFAIGFATVLIGLTMLW